jgi:hypothetical protein
MSMRLRNGLALLIALLVFGASSQSAVCEISCALLTGTGGCLVVASSSARHDVMNMAGMRCMGMAKSAMQDTSASIGIQMDGSCNHPFVLALGKNIANKTPFANMQWLVVDVLPLQTTLFGRDRITIKIPPLRSAAINPLLISLRV